MSYDNGPASRETKRSAQVVGLRIDAVSVRDVVDQVAAWVHSRESRTVCCANVHVTMMARNSNRYRAALQSMDIVTPDGMPLVWALRRFGFPHQQRAYGPDVMLSLCQHAASNGVPVLLYGSTQRVVERLRERLVDRYPGLRVADAISPPFRDLTSNEDERMVGRINASGAAIVFVGLGAPKQELWMASHRDRVMSVMVGVGAAFDFHAGLVAQAPPWMQRHGLEWVYRLSREPRRLWRRYLLLNPRFAVLAARQIVQRRR